MTSVRKQSSRPKHVPQRTCIGCREIRPKRELIRVVRTESGVEIDPTGKKSGRGTYLCKTKSCWDAALKNILKTYTPIVIGYGGNDGSLMGFLKNFNMI